MPPMHPWRSLWVPGDRLFPALLLFAVEASPGTPSPKPATGVWSGALPSCLRPREAGEQGDPVCSQGLCLLPLHAYCHCQSHATHHPGTAEMLASFFQVVHIGRPA